MGDSRGHWEGDTLVIETTNLNGKNPFRGSSENMRVTERIARVDADTLQLQVHRQRSRDVDRAVDGGSADDEVGRTDLRARVPRGQLRRDEHARGRRLEDKKAAEGAAKKTSN